MQISHGNSFYISYQQPFRVCESDLFIDENKYFDKYHEMSTNDFFDISNKRKTFLEEPFKKFESELLKWEIYQDGLFKFEPKNKHEKSVFLMYRDYFMEANAILAILSLNNIFFMQNWSTRKIHPISEFDLFSFDGKSYGGVNMFDPQISYRMGYKIFYS